MYNLHSHVPSFFSSGGATILGDAAQLGIGYMIVFVYVMVMLGRFNCVEQRVYLSGEAFDKGYVHDHFWYCIDVLRYVLCNYKTMKDFHSLLGIRIQKGNFEHEMHKRMHRTFKRFFSSQSWIFNFPIEQLKLSLFMYKYVYRHFIHIDRELNHVIIKANFAQNNNRVPK